jgi:CRP-like cAMP-binding protein
MEYDFYAEEQILSDYSSFSKQQASLCQIEALEDSKIMSLSFEAVEMLYTKVPIMYKLATSSLDAVYVLNFEKYSDLVLLDLEARYQKFMTQKAKIARRIPQYMVASYLGISPEALTRLRRRIGL